MNEILVTCYDDEVFDEQLGLNISRERRDTRTHWETTGEIAEQVSERSVKIWCL